MKPKLLFVVGPTASGKTDAAIELALRCGGEIVSADSVAICRGMDIGSAKPSIEEMRGVPHHLLSFADPAVPYSVSEYRRDALRIGGLSDGAQSMQAIGYKEIAAYLRGETTLEEARGNMQRNTRHLAKRQLTWFRALDKIRWFDLESYADPGAFFRDLAAYSLGNSSIS